MRRPAAARVLSTFLLAAAVLLTASPAFAASSWLPVGAELIDRKFPASWCPYEFVRFTALDSRATLVFEAENLDAFAEAYEHQLDNLMVVQVTAWEGYAELPPWLGGSCNCFGEDPQSTFYYDEFLAAPGADPAQLPYLELFDTDPTVGPQSAWTLSAGAAYSASPGGSAPASPYDFPDIDPTSGTLVMSLGSGIAGSITASVDIEGLVPGAEYVLAGWWSVVFGGSCDTADSPLTVDVIGEDATAVPSTGVSLGAPVRIEAAQPNPFTDRTLVEMRVPVGDRGELRIYDVAGRLVRRLEVLDDGDDVRAVSWNGRDAEGRPVASGTYLLRLESVHGVHSTRVAVVR